ncbi:MAG: GHMP kinase [Lentisphaerae bacterium]|nr:GHMP kinase [Lentisphaerota bacterium]
MIITRNAYPRAALIGNPSDGYYGKTIAFVFDNYSASVQLYETPTISFLSASRDLNEFDNLEDLDRKISRFGYYGGIRLLKASARKFLIYCRERGITIEKKNFTLRYHSDIPNRLGLAGSSAIITAAIRAIAEFYDVALPPAELANVVLAAERDELSIPAGLQDRVAQAFNHPVYMDFDREYMDKFGFGNYEKIDIPEGINFYVAYRTDLAEGSEILHSRLKDDYEAKVPQVLAAMQEWADLTVQMREAMISGKFSIIPQLINRNFDLRSEVCSGSISAKNRRMVEIARNAGASAKFTGSGGAIVGTFEDGDMFQKLQKDLSCFGVDVVKPSIVTGDERQ